jgi:hydroxymethylglutaryl-CoA lyase
VEAAGARRIETVSFANPSVLPQMAGAEEICAALGDRSFAAIGLVLNDRGMERALDCDLDEINLVAYASDGYAMKNTNAHASIRNDEVADLVSASRQAGRPTTVTITVAFGDPVEGQVPIERVAEIAGRVAEAGADEIALGDTIGTGVPTTVRQVLEAVSSAVGDTPLRCHFHNTRNTGYANAVAALDFGVATLDSAVGGYGGSPFSPGAGGNLATEDLTAMLTAMGIEHGIDTSAMTETGIWLAGLLGHDQPPATLSRAATFPGS